MSQAPGLSGTPDSGHCCRAATRASCAKSSARPTSRTIRARPAISRADSILQTASTARRGSVISRLVLRQLLLELPSLLHRRAVAELDQLVDLANFDLGLPPEAVAGVERNPLRPLHGLCQGLGLDDPVPGHQLLGLGERSVDHGPLSAGEPDPGTFAARLQPGAVQHHAG